MDETTDLAKLFGFAKSVQLNSLGMRLHIIARPSEDLLATAYLQIKHEGLAHVVWHQGRIPPLTEFLAWGSNPSNCIYACMAERIGEDSVTMAGLGWSVQITPVCLTEGNEAFKAEVGMSFFRAFQVDGLPQEFCEMCIDHGFETLKLVAMYGTTPMPNRVARIFHTKAGFKDLAIFPNYTSWMG